MYIRIQPMPLYECIPLQYWDTTAVGERVESPQVTIQALSVCGVISSSGLASQIVLVGGLWL